jgi:nitrogen regulatory protein PII
MQEANTLYEVKAYIRPERIDAVVRALDDLGVCQMTIIDVQALGKGMDPDSYRYSVEFIEKYSTLAKLELICPHVRVESLVEAIVREGRTGKAGDGYIYLTAVAQTFDLSLVLEQASSAPECAD